VPVLRIDASRRIIGLRFDALIPVETGRGIIPDADEVPAR